MKATQKYHILFLVALLPGITMAQAQEDRVKAIGEKACGCAGDIDGSQTKDKVIEAINSCIDSRTMLYDMQQATAQAEKDRQDGATEKKSYNVTVGGNNKEVLAYLNKNCATVQSLMTADVVSPNAMSTDKKALSFYNEAMAYTDEKKYDLALVSYNKAVKQDPKFITAWNYMGLNYRRLSNYSEAIKCYKKSLELDPKGVFALQNMAVAYQLQLDYANAGKAYEGLITADPKNPEGYFGAGQIYYTNLNEPEKGLGYMFTAYLLYNDMQSPYTEDARSVLAGFLQDLKEKGKEAMFKEVAEKNGIKLE